ncbi:MAG TPA: glycosyltransferase family 2 protein [Thermoanaerobaculia bacterium]|nr:glycosyltransferase family 2 protein [Thermoanaerobaculia bacterium]
MAIIPALSVVIPVYRSEEILPQLIARLVKTLPTVASEFEIILVNDGSPDRSWERIADLARVEPAVRGVNLMRNYGQHNALLAGIRRAKYPLTITMDDDLQHPPEEIARLLEHMGDRYDVVYGVPEHDAHGLLRTVASQLTKLTLQKAMGADTARRISAFRALRTNLREAFDSYGGSFVSIDVLLTWATTRFAHITVRHDPRRHGVSGYSIWKLLAHAANMMTGFSVLPLQIASIVGFVLTGFGTVVLAWVIGAYLVARGETVPGFAFLASIIAIFSGAQLFALGIIGEYLARMHFRVMNRPSYVVREATSAIREARADAPLASAETELPAR